MRSARACIGWQILSANKTGKAERRLNKRAVSDRNVRDYLHFAGRCGVVSGIWGGGVWQGWKVGGRRVAVCVALQADSCLTGPKLPLTGVPVLRPRCHFRQSHEIKFRVQAFPRIKPGLMGPAGPLFLLIHPSDGDKWERLPTYTRY